jgi:alpha-N-acetylglucosaminidase
MRSLGMLPVLPGFAGQVPEGFAKLHPESKFTQQLWQNFDSNYSGVYLLDPTDKLFVEIGKLFIQEQTKVMSGQLIKVTKGKRKEILSKVF